LYKFFLLIFKNIGRNRVRTTLTAVAMVVLACIYSVVSNTVDFVNRLINNQASQTRLIVRERWVLPSRFPARYVQNIAKIQGIEEWTVWRRYGGTFDNSGRNDRFGFGLAVPLDTLRSMHEGLDALDPALVDALRRDKTGALMGPSVMKNMNWQVGQRFIFTSATHPGKNLEFRIVGVLPPGRWSRTFFFRDDYFQEGTGDKDYVSLMWLRVRDEETGRRVAAEIDRMFANSPSEMQCETESAGVARFAGRNQHLLIIINLIVSILLIDMVVILSNSISITVRERSKELAVLKVLGFQPGFLISMVVGEAMLVGTIGGVIGGSLAYSVSALNALDMLPGKQIQFLLEFPIPPVYVLWGLAMGAGVGFVGSVVPAWGAPKVKVSDVFSKIT
jgi:putative ABC transport system permease protein